MKRYFYVSASGAIAVIALTVALVSTKDVICMPFGRTVVERWEGMVQRTQERLCFSGWIRHGIDEAWYRDGRRAFIGSYSSGLREGVWYTWHDNGVLESCEIYSGGVLVGTSVQWGKDGKVACVALQGDTNVCGFTDSFSSDGVFYKRLDYAE